LKKEERLLRIGVLGCGPMAQAAHFDATRKARNAELYAICDRAPDLLAAMAAEHRPHVTYQDYDAMLADPQVEAVIIATSDPFHVPLALKALDAGKHVLVEKPLGVTIEECERLRDRVQETGLIVQVGNMKRFDPGIAYAHRFIQEEMGQHMALKAWYCDSVYRYTMVENVQPPILTSEQAVRPAGNPKADRRRYLMLTHGSHLVDMARFLGGEIVSVQAKLVERFGAYCWFISVDYADGSVGHLDLNIAIQGNWEEGFQVYGEKGSVKGKVHMPWFHKTSEVECFSSADGLYRRPLGEDAYTYRLQIEGFADTILKGVPLHGASVEDGLAAMRTMVAIARSVETGQTVRLADVTGGV
jgi:predicted dehydrogenase